MMMTMMMLRHRRGKSRWHIIHRNTFFSYLILSFSILRKHFNNEEHIL